TRSKRDWSSDVCSSDLITPEGIKRAEDVSPNESITHHTGRKLVWLTVMLAVIAAGLLAFQLLRPKSATTAAASTTSTTASAALQIGRASCRERVEICGV